MSGGYVLDLEHDLQLAKREILELRAQRDAAALGWQKVKEAADELRDAAHDILGFFNPNECDCAGVQAPCALCRLRVAIRSLPEEPPEESKR